MTESSERRPSAADAEAPNPAPTKTRKRRTLRKAWRPWLRAIHRDAGYFVVGLTFVYALSGLAVNHIADWDPNFRQFERTHQLSAPITGDDQRAAKQVLDAVGHSDATPEDVYRASDTQLEIVLEHATLHVNTQTGLVQEEGQKPRFLIRVANWLHLNRGKQAWTYIADTYAVILLFLASSGLFMIAGRKGLFGRGGIIVSLGVLVPVLYVVLSGGP